MGFDSVSDIPATSRLRRRGVSRSFGRFPARPRKTGSWYRVCPWRRGGRAFPLGAKKGRRRSALQPKQARGRPGHRFQRGQGDRAEAGGPRLQGRRDRRRAAAARQHRRRRDHRRRRGDRRRPPRAPVAEVQGEGRRRLAVGQLGDRQEDQPAGDDRAGPGRVDLLGGGAVHPVRHPGRQPRLRGADAGGRTPGHDGRAAGGGEEGQDRRLHRRRQPGGPHPGGGRRRRLRAAERLRGQLRRRRRGASSPWSTSAPAPSTSTSSRAASRCSRAT